MIIIEVGPRLGDIMILFGLSTLLAVFFRLLVWLMREK